MSGITFTGINPNISFPQRTITHVQEGGLRLQSQTVDLTLFSRMSFTICVVMKLWLNRAMSIKTDINNGTYERPHLIYEHVTKRLKLQTTGYRPGQNRDQKYQGHPMKLLSPYQAVLMVNELCFG